MHPISVAVPIECVCAYEADKVIPLRKEPPTLAMRHLPTLVPATNAHTQQRKVTAMQAIDVDHDDLNIKCCCDE